ncbi:cytochrome P450 [Tanacetum coccineum]
MEITAFVMENNLLTSLFLILTPFILLFITKKYSKTKENLPPGPRPLPIIGNIHQMGNKPHVSTAMLAKEYGPLVSLRLGSKLLVVASSPEAAKEILKTQDRHLSGRNVPDALNISDVDYHFVWAKDCNEHWKSLRTISRSEMFSSKAIEAESNLRHEKLAQMLNFLNTKQGQVVKIEEVVSLPYLPLVTTVAILAKEFLDLNDEHGTAHWIKFWTSKRHWRSYDTKCKELFIAGTDTVVSTIEWAMAELLKNKEILDKVHKELKRELNSNSIMKSDLSKLTYFNACVKETLRLHPVVPLLIPRRALEACEVMNYTIPQNSQVWVNIWAISRDPKVWEDPDTFKPERFVGSHLDFSGRDFEFIPFGGGRRMCPGLPSAIKSLQTILASLILEYDWVLPNGEDPKNLDMNEKFGVTLQKEKPLELIFKHKE